MFLILTIHSLFLSHSTQGSFFISLYFSSHLGPCEKNDASIRERMKNLITDVVYSPIYIAMVRRSKGGTNTLGERTTTES